MILSSNFDEFGFSFFFEILFYIVSPPIRIGILETFELEEFSKLFIIQTLNFHQKMQENYVD